MDSVGSGLGESGMGEPRAASGMTTAGTALGCTEGHTEFGSEAARASSGPEPHTMLWSEVAHTASCPGVRLGVELLLIEVPREPPRPDLAPRWLLGGRDGGEGNDATTLFFFSFWYER